VKALDQRGEMLAVVYLIIFIGALFAIVRPW